MFWTKTCEIDKFMIRQFQCQYFERVTILNDNDQRLKTPKKENSIGGKRAGVEEKNKSNIQDILLGTSLVVLQSVHLPASFDQRVNLEFCSKLYE